MERNAKRKQVTLGATTGDIYFMIVVMAVSYMAAIHMVTAGGSW